MRCRAVSPLDTSHPRLEAGKLGISTPVFAVLVITSRSLQREQMLQDHQTLGAKSAAAGFHPLWPCLSATALHFFPVPYPQNRGFDVVHSRPILLYPRPLVDGVTRSSETLWAFPKPANPRPASDPFHSNSVRGSDFNVL